MDQKLEIGLIKLRNGKKYPFNDSLCTVALKTQKASVNYFVNTQIMESDGEVGDVVVSAMAVNGFKIAYTGSAKNVVLQYCVFEGPAQ